jgi:hypothetical protein
MRRCESGAAGARRAIVGDRPALRAPAPALVAVTLAPRHAGHRLVVACRRLPGLDPREAEGETPGEIQDAGHVLPERPDAAHAEQVQRDAGPDDPLRDGEEATRPAFGQDVARAAEAALVDRGERQLGEHRGACQAVERGAGWVPHRVPPRGHQRQPRGGRAGARGDRDEDGPRKMRLRAHTGTAVAASSTPV